MRNRAESTLQTGQVECYDSSGRFLDCAWSGQDAKFGSGTQCPGASAGFDTAAE